MCGHRPSEADVRNFLEASRSQFVSIPSLATKEFKRAASRPADSEPQSTSRFSTTEFETLVVEVLKTMGGKARKRDVEEEAFRRNTAIFKQPNYQKSVGEGIPAWKKHLQFARQRLCNKGFLEKPNVAGVGVWQLARKGWDFAPGRQKRDYE